MNPKFDQLKLMRTQPVQGKPVEVVVLWNGQDTGVLVLPFTAWLKIKRLLEKGQEMDARENHALQLQVSIAGIQEQAQEEAKVLPPPGVKFIPAIEIDEIAAVVAAEEAREEQEQNTVRELPPAGQVQPGAIRTLRGE